MGQILSPIKDPRRMGQWTGHKVRLRARKTSSFITTYRPCSQSSNKGNLGLTTVTNPQNLLYQIDKWEDIDPRQQFMDDIIEEITEMGKDPNNGCILMWDALSIVYQW
jgi:hypothetical protein